MRKIQSVYFYRVLLGTAICAISFLATTSRHIPVVENISDKINHVAAFYILSLLVDCSWPKTGFRASKILPLLGYGLLIEITQYFLPSRSCSLYDLGADALGMFLYWISIPLLMKIPLVSRR